MVSFLNHIVFWGHFSSKLMFFDQIKYNVNWPPCSNDHFSKWENFLNPIWVTEASNRTQKCPNMLLNVKFSQPYCEYPVGAVYPLLYCLCGRERSSGSGGYIVYIQWDGTPITSYLACGPSRCYSFSYCCPPPGSGEAPLQEGDG